MASNNNPQPNSTTLGLRALVLFYVLYLAYGIAKAYATGDPEALSLPMTIVCVGAMVIGAVVLLVLTWRQWKSAKNAPVEEDEPSDEDEEAE